MPWIIISLTSLFLFIIPIFLIFFFIIKKSKAKRKTQLEILDTQKQILQELKKSKG